MVNHMNKCVVCGEVKPTWNPTMFYEAYGSEKCTCTYCLAESFSDMLKTKDARIAALESALAKAEEALEEAYQPEGSHFVGEGCACVGCKYRRCRAALAAIRDAKASKEARHD